MNKCWQCWHHPPISTSFREKPAFSFCVSAIGRCQGQPDGKHPGIRYSSEPEGLELAKLKVIFHAQSYMTAVDLRFRVESRQKEVKLKEMLSKDNLLWLVVVARHASRM